jgi:hypothetical protein
MATKVQSQGDKVLVRAAEATEKIVVGKPVADVGKVGTRCVKQSDADVGRATIVGGGEFATETEMDEGPLCAGSSHVAHLHQGIHGEG